MRGSAAKVKSLKNLLNEVIRQNKHMQMKEQVLNITSKRKKLANMLYQTHKNCIKQTTFWKVVIIQRRIRILSQRVMIINFISSSLEFIDLLICEKIAGVIFVQTKWKKNRKDTLTPKMPFADRFSCCATIDFNSISNYFPGGLCY